MKVSHEVPFEMMSQSRLFNDFDYALVHLFPENPLYFNFFKESLEKGREVILDNSVFELGKPVSGDFYKKWISELKPTYFIAPDKFGDSKFTIGSIKEWSVFSKESGFKMIGVIQGLTVEEMISTYKEIEPYCDKVAFSFAQPLFKNLIKTNSDDDYVFGRVYLINKLLNENVINVNKPHHLLGCSLPQEMCFYKHPLFSFIESVDSSSPVLHGYEGVFYNKTGLSSKIKKKLIDIIDKPLKNEDIIEFNIKLFKTFL